MNIPIPHQIIREGKAFSVYEGHERVAVFDTEFDCIIMGVSPNFGRVFIENGDRMPTCWSQNSLFPSPCKKPQSKQCLEIDAQTGGPDMSTGTLEPVCKHYGNGCIPAVSLVLMATQLGTQFRSLVLFGDEVSGKSRPKDSLYSLAGFHRMLETPGGKRHDPSLFRLKIVWSEEKKRIYIKVGEKYDLHPDRQKGQALNDDMVELHKAYRDLGETGILHSINPLYWATPKHPKIKEARNKRLSAQKLAAKALTDKRLRPKGRMHYLRMTLARVDIKPETRERLQKEMDEISGEEE